jgi:pimeloyl-ACP methyl ester carboxylesterase
VRFDTRGFGRSSLNNSKKPWTMNDLSQDILSVAKATHTESFHLVGESMGGTACLYLATQANHPLLSLTCVSTSHQGGRVQRVSSWREEVESSGIEVWSDQMMERRFFPDALSRDQWNWFSELQKQTSADALLEGGELLMRTDLSQDIEKINIPTLLLAPDSSPFIPVEIPKEVHERIKNSKLVIMPHSRHGLPFSHARQCAELLLDFLSTQKN